MVLAWYAWIAVQQQVVAKQNLKPLFITQFKFKGTPFGVPLNLCFNKIFLTLNFFTVYNFTIFNMYNFVAYS